MRSLVVAVVTVGVGLAGLVLTTGIFLASGQRQTQEQIRQTQEQIRQTEDRLQEQIRRTEEQVRLLGERVSSLETAVRIFHPSPAARPDTR